MHTVALAQLTMVFDTESLIKIINDCKTTDWPNELSHMAVTKLKNEYVPDDRISKIGLSAIMMNISNEPKYLFDKVAGTQRNFTSTNYTVSE